MSEKMTRGGPVECFFKNKGAAKTQPFLYRQSCWCKNLSVLEKLESRESRSPSGPTRSFDAQVSSLPQQEWSA